MRFSLGQTLTYVVIYQIRFFEKVIIFILFEGSSWSLLSLIRSSGGGCGIGPRERQKQWCFVFLKNWGRQTLSSSFIVLYFLKLQSLFSFVLQGYSLPILQISTNLNSNTLFFLRFVMCCLRVVNALGVGLLQPKLKPILQIRVCK